MERKGMTLAIALAVACAAAPHAHATEARHGVIVSLVPIENRGADESEVVQKRRKIGGALGGLIGRGAAILGTQARGKAHDVGYAAGAVAMTNGSQIGEAVAAKAGGQGPTTRYMVKVKLDGGKTLAITQLRAQVAGLHEGSRIRVEGKGDDAAVFAE